MDTDNFQNLESMVKMFQNKIIFFLLLILFFELRIQLWYLFTYGIYFKLVPLILKLLIYPFFLIFDQRCDTALQLTLEMEIIPLKYVQLNLVRTC